MKIYQQNEKWICVTDEWVTWRMTRDLPEDREDDNAAQQTRDGDDATNIGDDRQGIGITCTQLKYNEKMIREI